MKRCKMIELCMKKTWKNKQVSQNNLYEYILSPFVTTIVFCLMNKNQDVKLILIGVSIMILWSVNIFESAYMVIDEKVNGTLGNVLISPFQTQFILFSESLCSVIYNVPVIAVVFATTYWICPYVFELKQIMWLLVAYVLCIVSIATISLFFATLLLFAKSARGIMNIIEYPFYILSGLLIPIDSLPMCIQCLSQLIPSTHAFNIFREVLNGRGETLGTNVSKCLIMLILVHLFINIVLRHTEKEVLVRGTIDVY